MFALSFLPQTNFVSSSLFVSCQLASCLINAQPLPAQPCHRRQLDWLHRPRPDRRLVTSHYPFRRKPMPLSVLIRVRSFIEPDVLKTMYHSTIPLQFIWSICSGNYGKEYTLDSELHYFSIFFMESTLSSANFTDGNILVTYRTHIMKITYSRSARA